MIFTFEILSFLQLKKRIDRKEWWLRHTKLQKNFWYMSESLNNYFPNRVNPTTLKGTENKDFCFWLLTSMQYLSFATLSGGFM